MIITIHQPEHLVWLGLLDKIAQAETYVALDTVQYRKLYFQNRNRIVTSNGLEWLTVPLKKHPTATLIRDIEIAYEQDWTKRYLAKLEHAYKKARFFDRYYPDYKAILQKGYRFLVSLNIDLLKLMLNNYDIDTEVVAASDLECEKANDGTEVNLNICEALGAKTYLSGPFGKDYLDLQRFDNAGINVVFHEFRHPCYTQLQNDFTPNASAIDLLFNHGPLAREILFAKNNQEDIPCAAKP